MEGNDKATYFNSQVAAEWAATEYTPDELGKIDRMLSTAGLRPGMMVLEPGSGTGRLTEILSERVGSNGRVLALDISPRMVEASRKRLEGRTNVAVLCNRLEDLHLRPAELDLVICHQVFPHFDDKLAALQHMASALKPTGKLMIFHFIASSIINDRHRKAHPSVLNDMMPGPDEMERLMASVGLEVDLLSDDDEGYLLRAIRPTK
jgi:ubiquinone/menaquinone biosynthesis C-methylase UbiE